MDFKKKAGLALALAAIFTTGGANMALAADNSTDNQTITDENVGAPAKNDGTEYVNVTGAVPDNGAINLASGSNLQSLNITTAVAAAEVKEVVVGASTTITGMNINSGGSLVTANGKPVETLNITASGTVALTLGGTVAGQEYGGSLENIALGTGTTTATIIVQNGDFAAKNLVATETGNKLELTVKNADMALSGIDMSKTASDGTGNKITIGETGSGTAAKFAVNGGINLGKAGVLSIDPDWVDGGGKPLAITEAVVTGSYVGGLEVAQNAYFAIGAPYDSLRAIRADIEGRKIGKFGEIGVAGNTFGAMLGIFEPLTLTTGGAGFIVDADHAAVHTTAGSTATGNTDTLSLSNGSLLVLDLENRGGTPFTFGLATGGGLFLGYDDSNNDATLAADANAATHDVSLYVANARGNETNTVLIGNIVNFNLDGTARIDSAGDAAAANTALTASGSWQNYASTVNKNDTLIFSSDLIIGNVSFVERGATGIYDVVLNTSVADVQSVYPDLSSGLAGMVGDVYKGGNNNVFIDNDGGNTYGLADAPDGAVGIAFVSRATDNRFMPDHREAAAVLEGAAQIAVAAGVPAVTNNVITRISSLIVDHNNLLNDTQPAYGNEPGSFGIWANPFYATGDTDGMDAGRFQNGFDYNYGGAAFGIDYNINEAFRLGLALNVGGGDSDSEDGNSDFNTTNADFDFFGVSLYGSYTNGAFGLTGDLGFTGVDYEIDQNLPGSMGMGNLESDVDTNAFTLGLTGQYRFAASDNFNITPHLGLRFTQISVDDSDVNLRGGGRVFDVTTEDQNLFQIPVGVEFSSNIVTDGGWTVTPSADLGVLFTAGDTDVESRARIAGTSFTGRTSADVNDSAAFQGRLGVKAAADNGLSLGLDYGILAGANQTDHQFSGMLRFEF